MADWKFTDQYKDYPALANSILSKLVFDVASGSPVTDGRFSAPLDLAATGTIMGVLSKLIGIEKIPFGGTVSTADKTLTVELDTTDNPAILAALSKCLPLIGDRLASAGLRIRNKTAASSGSDDKPAVDRFDIAPSVKIGNRSIDIVAQVPQSTGPFEMGASIKDFGVSLSDLNFLVPNQQFSSMFPADLPAPYYTPNKTALNLLSLQLGLDVQTSPKLSVSAAKVGVAIGIVNIPLYPNALFLNPLSVAITVSNPLSDPKPSWQLSADVKLYPYAQQTNPPKATADFSYGLKLDMPGAKKEFTVRGGSAQSALPVSQIFCDLMNNGDFNTGIATQLTVEKFDFSAEADKATGTINNFSCEVAMNASKNNDQYFGLFNKQLGVKHFSIAVAYKK